MQYDVSEIMQYIQIAKKKHKEGNLVQANEIYKKLINQKIYTYDLLLSYGLFNKEINCSKPSLEKTEIKALLIFFSSFIKKNYNNGQF